MREKYETICAIICAILLSIILILSVSCIPVTIRPEFDDAGLPKAIPVAPVGSQDSAGMFHPPFPVSEKSPTPPPSFPWETILQVGLGVLGVGGLSGAGVAMRTVGRAKTALSLVCSLADAQEATSDPEALKRNKMLAAQAQEAAGVRSLINHVRKKKSPTA
jgi:hypothetical protein